MQRQVHGQLHTSCSLVFFPFNSSTACHGTGMLHVLDTYFQHNGKLIKYGAKNEPFCIEHHTQAVLITMTTERTAEPNQKQ